MPTYPPARPPLVFVALVALLCLASPPQAFAQTFPTGDPVIHQMWEVGIEHSQTEELAHVLMDYIGPRLAGSPNLAASQDWLVERYEQWGVPVRKEEYGTWRGWRQGILHVDMLEPRVRTLEAHLLAWSPGTDGPVESEVVAPPEDLTEDTAPQWLESVEGKLVLMSAPEQMCRAHQELEKHGSSRWATDSSGRRGSIAQAPWAC